MIRATYLGANGWLLDFSGIRLLIDPWLTGKLSFPPGDWFLKGTLPRELEIPENIDLILLTQGIEDHTHKETLCLFNKNIPIYGSESASKISKSLGYHNVTSLKPGDLNKFLSLEVRATKGAPIPNIENGYIIKHKNESVYIEPHGFLDDTLEKENIDIVITPVVDIGIKGLGLFIKGKSSITK